ncbi:Elongation factor, GTP-binding domain protein [Kalmanozyma brasiliensis GHG001]|uniref:Elongation factor, GTP-binding domain protein n=1 Tax=Kalmanozyma brasiliensis (strain GHG001) TaxID=1365824 RepID=UPI0028683308|nr:Elongation factor, GTP-binding domain protein [Kalmanozyma brasiliensis GHG001]KAF6767124.1 Elongation factor, GTP-binding domain protein [Kalmanozyma brasiliensis GHG001]
MSLARRCTRRLLSPAAGARRLSSPAVLSRPRSALHTASSLQASASRQTQLHPSSALVSIRTFSSTSQWQAADPLTPHAERHPISHLRNISIIAHIDAGKTTLTERLLHLTNALSSNSSTASIPGDVDTGSTVTDFLEAERQRGITIQSAAVGPVWWTSPTSPSRVGITLVDTPGHIDFGIEVERALRVVDGAVVVLDGVEGVESQTENVWAQAARYDVKASILFVNKLDRMGSSMVQSLKSVMRSGMHKRPLLLQLPLAVEGNEPGIAGVVDLVEMQTLRFSGKAGEIVTRTELREGDELWEEAKQARHALVECLASLDDQLLEELFGLPTGSNEEPHGKMPAASLKAAIRRQTLAGTILPVLCGSAGKNIGVQPLLDAIADYLPSPADKPSVIGTVASTASPSKTQAEQQDATPDGKQVPISLIDRRTTALAFKVVHDKRRGPTTFVRVYSGTLHRSTVLFNTTTGARERLSRVLFPFADSYTETDTLRAGQIGVILGLRDTRTGDTLVDVSSAGTAKAGTGAKGGMDANEVKTLRLKRVHIPPPVFSMSLEPASKSDVDAVSDALNLLIRTDPSLRLDESGEGTTGQTVLSGMGELHLEIAKDRLANEFGVNARMGAVRVSYRETLDEGLGGREVEETVERDLAGKKIKIGAKIKVRALGEDEMHLASGADAAVYGGNVVDVSFAPAGDAAGQVEGRKEKASAEDEGDIEAFVAETPRHTRGKNTAKTPAPSSKYSSITSPTNLPPGIDLITLSTMFKTGMVAALSRGPLTSNPVMNLRISISNVELFGELSSSAAVSYLLSHHVRKVLRTEPKVNPETGMATSTPTPLTTLMEPMMTTRIVVPEAHLGKVINDITAEQGGLVEDVVHLSSDSDTEKSTGEEEEVYIPNPTTNRFELQSSAASSGSGGKGVDGKGGQGKAEIHAVVPLANLVKYSSKLRALTAGNAQFSMQLQGFARVSKQRQAEILAELGR